MTPNSSQSFDQMTPKFSGHYLGILTSSYHQKHFPKVAPLVGKKGIQNFHTKKKKNPEKMWWNGLIIVFPSLRLAIRSSDPPIFYLLLFFPLLFFPLPLSFPFPFSFFFSFNFFLPSFFFLLSFFFILFNFFLFIFV